MEESIARKLAVPKKLSAYEREKQAAEAKKRQQEAENAAALKEFQKSLGVDSDDELPTSARRDRGPPNAPKSREQARVIARHAPGLSNGPPNSRSGPGSLGPVDGHLQPPSLKRKRALDEARENNRFREEEDELSRLKRDDRTRDRSRHGNDDLYNDLPKPTVYLQSLPPRITTEELKALLTPYLKVHSIRFTDQQQSESRKKTLTAIATLTTDTNLTQIENATRALKDKYLGCGYRLSMSRFDEAAFNASANNSRRQNGPFGATVAEAPRDSFSMRNAPPPQEHNDYGRRSYHDRRGYSGARRDAEVKVTLPLDICTVQAVHTIADRLLAEPNIDRAVELEALLMRVPEIQVDERFSFLYDSTSPAGVYYRYCLWNRDTMDDQRKPGQLPERIHDDTAILWDISTQEAPFPDLTHISQVVTDLDYVSSEDESDNEDARQRPSDKPEPDNLLAETERNFLLPLQHARLTHLLARLPIVNTRLRTGDVARITNFAIRHAGTGAGQIVDKLLLNVDMPFSKTSAAKYEGDSDKPDSDSEGEISMDDAEKPASMLGDASRDARQNDPSAAKLVALYVISDILSASATAGARNSWKYRQLFEAGFKSQQTFEKLGRLDQELGWGRIKMEQWKRKIGAIFDLWEGWSVFSSEAMQTFRRVLNNEPEPESEQVQATNSSSISTELSKPKWMTKVKVIDKDSTGAIFQSSSKLSRDRSRDGSEPDHSTSTQDTAIQPSDSLPVEHDPQNLESRQSDNVNAQAISEDPLSDSRPEELAQQLSVKVIPTASIAPANAKQTPQAPPKRRMRAEDMFADSDDDGD